MLYNLHTHSHYCGHGSGEISEYAEYAASKGFSMLGFSEHCPFPDSLLGNSRMPFSSMALYEDDVRRAGASLPFPVYLGYEIDYYDEYSSFFQSLSERTDFLIAGVHYVRRPDGTFRTLVCSVIIINVETAESGAFIFGNAGKLEGHHAPKSFRL